MTTLGECEQGDRVFYMLHRWKIRIVGAVREGAELVAVMNDLGQRFFLSSRVAVKPVVRIPRGIE